LELELLMTGIGGQGIQLAAHVLARATVAEGLHAQLFGSYAGMMRGGSTEATLVLGTEQIEAPPTVHQAWAAILMHHDHAPGVISRLRPGGLALVNATVFEGAVDQPSVEVVEIAATDIALEVGHIMCASMVMVGTFAKLSGLLSLAALGQAVADALPPYRSQHIALNRAALEAGFAAAPEHVVPTWAVPA
jgi:2-oxoglutarate ferredoxin oxidoreductase subunit gamma